MDDTIIEKGVCERGEEQDGRGTPALVTEVNTALVSCAAWCWEERRHNDSTMRALVGGEFQD